MRELSKKDIEVLGFRHPKEFKAYTQTVRFNCYDQREIYIEKCRASLTRQIFKLRDYIDILALENEYECHIPELSDEIAEKTEYTLKIYQKYRENIKQQTKSSPSQIEEKKLLIKPMSSNIQLDKEISRIKRQLTEISRLKKYLTIEGS